MTEQRRWHPKNADDYQRVIDRDVYTHDGERIGRVDRIIHPAPEMEGRELGHFLVVRPDGQGGPLGAEVAYVPETAVAIVNQDAVELTVDAGQIADQGWANLPVDLDPQSTPLPEDVPPAPEGGWYEESHRSTE